MHHIDFIWFHIFRNTHDVIAVGYQTIPNLWNRLPLVPLPLTGVFQVLKSVASDCLFGVLTVILQSLPAIDYEKGRNETQEILDIADDLVAIFEQFLDIDDSDMFFFGGILNLLWHSSTEICCLLLKEHCLWFNHLQTKATRPWWHPVLRLFGWLGCGRPATHHTSLPSHASAHCWWEVPTKGLCVSTTKAEAWWLFSSQIPDMLERSIKEALSVVSWVVTYSQESRQVSFGVTVIRKNGLILTCTWDMVPTAVGNITHLCVSGAPPPEVCYKRKLDTLVPWVLGCHCSSQDAHHPILTWHNLTVAPVHFVPIQLETRNMSLYDSLQMSHCFIEACYDLKRSVHVYSVIWNSGAGVLVWCFHRFTSPEKSCFHGVFPSTCLSPYFLCFDQNSPRCLFGMYGTELLFHQWFLREAAACRSTPEDADLFYVPSLGTWLARTFDFLFSSVFFHQVDLRGTVCLRTCTVIVYLCCTCTALTPSCPLHARLYGYTSASCFASHLLMTKLQVLFQMHWSAQLFRPF